MIFTTSYMANWRHFGDYIPVSIMAHTPSYFTGRTLKQLAPKEDLLHAYKHGKISFEEYELEYRSQLYSLGVEGIIEEALHSIGNHNLVLVCTCKDREKCHRSILADFLEEETGLPVLELPNTDTGLYIR